MVFATIFEEDRQLIINKLGIKDDLNIKDTELIMKLYLEFGTSGLQNLSDGFIFIIIDYVKEKVLAFRDHIGIKNICYFPYNIFTEVLFYIQSDLVLENAT